MSYQLLVCTVGGAPEPLTASILHHQPERVLFVVSPQTKSSVDEHIRPALESHENPMALDPARFEFVDLRDAQDFEHCVRILHDAYRRQVQPWLDRGDDFTVTVDFTGGTKCMTAALALVARRWNCRFSYVGGSKRTKEGVGIVLSGREQILHTANPWDALGFESVEQAALLFNRGDYPAASQLLETAKRRASDQIKRGLNTLQQLADAYDLWERFQHREAEKRLRNVLRNENDLRVWLMDADTTLQVIRQHITQLAALPDEPHAFVHDLFANAERCAHRARFDDAVARLYRACEAGAQFRLHERQFADHPHGQVRFDRLPEPLQTKWRSRAEDGIVRLGVQDDYELLAEADDPLGHRFRELGLADRKASPLNERNSSILAHGQSPISEKGYTQLARALRELLTIQTEDLPRFPELRL